MVTFTVPTCPYDRTDRLYSRKEVAFFPGFTPLVGCNGSGKSTLLNLIADELRDRPDAALIRYNDRTDGQSNLIESMMFRNNVESAASVMVSSEGERINHGVGILVSRIGTKVRQEHPKEIWVLMDSVGSGLSIDYIGEIKDFVAWIRGQEPGIEFYFIVSTNEYEFARNEKCLDVTTFNRIEFEDYEQYRDFILKTRKKKDKRYEKVAKGNEHK